jgi:hypothetical protein
LQNVFDDFIPFFLVVNGGFDGLGQTSVAEIAVVLVDVPAFSSLLFRIGKDGDGFGVERRWFGPSACPVSAVF